MNNIETIEVSAIKYKWGEVVTGLRHSDVIKVMADRRIKTNGNNSVQGFVTSSGRFLDRNYAAEHAKICSKQISEEHKGPLYSEDLW